MSDTVECLFLLLRSEASAGVKAGADPAAVESAYDALLSLVNAIVALDGQAEDESTPRPDLSGLRSRYPNIDWAAVEEDLTDSHQRHVKSVVREHVKAFTKALRDSVALLRPIIHTVRPGAPVESAGQEACSYAELVLEFAGQMYLAMLKETDLQAVARWLEGNAFTYDELDAALVIENWPAVASRLQASEKVFPPPVRMWKLLRFTTLQREIWDALDDRAMTADDLESELAVSRSTLFGGKAGGLNELREKRLILNDRKIGGYYRPDAPP